MKPALSYYGSKWRAATRYPAPTYPLVIEPFAGAAGYSLRYDVERALLLEKDARIAGIWQYLIASTPEDVLQLPLLGLDEHIDSLPPCDLNGRELIRAWLQGGARNAKSTFSSMAKNNLRKNPHTPSFWGAACRSRLAAQVTSLKGWTIINGDYRRAPDVEATWFIDPPYNNAAGRVYNHHAIDYKELGEWCRTRRGQVIVCENMGADLLPFRPLYAMKNNWNGSVKHTVEAVWP